jgi:alkanesulfonate monooxygenase SsuD/methylene tetrahydromethanopterin reductase-like flavin-dependent oxidoreductase (luciferase family)
VCILTTGRCALKFGIDLYPHFSVDLSGPAAFEHAVRQVRAAHEGGFDGIFASHHYALGTTEQMFQPIPLLARLAAEAPGMTLGTAVFLLSMHNPLEAAELMATLDIIAGGRSVFGVGQGYRDVEFASMGIPKAARGDRLREAMEVVRRLWAEDSVTWNGRHFRLDGVTINPKPVQRPGPLVWVGGDTLKGVAVAADIADAWLTSPRHSKSFIRQAAQVYRERRQGLGLPVRPPVFFREMYVAPTREEAEQLVGDAFERLYSVYHCAGQPGERYDRSFKELRDERIIVGDPEDVRREIQRYRDEFGAECMFFRVYYLGMDPERSVDCIKLFGREVIPHFSDSR